MVWVAPRSRAHSSFRGSRSIAMMVPAPASRAPMMAASPTPPQPMTATESPLETLPVLTAAPTPGAPARPPPEAVAGVARRTEPRHHTTAQQADNRRIRAGIDLGALAG